MRRRRCRCTSPWRWQRPRPQHELSGHSDGRGGPGGARAPPTAAARSEGARIMFQTDTHRTKLVKRQTEPNQPTRLVDPLDTKPTEPKYRLNRNLHTCYRVTGDLAKLEISCLPAGVTTTSLPAEEQPKVPAQYHQSLPPILNPPSIPPQTNLAAPEKGPGHRCPLPSVQQK